MTIGIIRERKNPPDKRVALTPLQCKTLVQKYPGLKILVEPSPIRTFSDNEYRDAGFELSPNLQSCDVLIGVKEVPVEALIPNKTYFFFSHTYKKQDYNKALLKSVLEKKIELIDYELLKYPVGDRLLGFGRYAGLVGAYNGFRLLGKQTDRFSLKPAHQCYNLKELMQELKKVQLPKGFKIVATGDGRVGHGAMEILDALGILRLNPSEFIAHHGDEPAFTQLGVCDYNRKKDGSPSTKKEFYQNPERFESDFMRFAQTSDMYLACHYWSDKSPFIFSRADAKNPRFKIKTIADISCDIDCAVASTLRSSTIEDPFYGYLAQDEKEIEALHPEAIAVMAVDNLPCELPRDASEGFGQDFLEKVMPHFMGDDPDNIIYHATESTPEGRLNRPFLYLNEWLNE